jgi:uncharacterized SAM-binding protein YcdF (DUF218 family)
MRPIHSGKATGEAGSRHRTTPTNHCGIRVALVALCLAVLLPAAGFLIFVRQMPTVETTPTQKADGIVVLTGAAYRINDALALLAAGHGRRVLITGVNPATRPIEIARQMPEHQRWFSCCVDFDHSATNTSGNAREAKRWVRRRGFQSLIVVTSNFHMLRAMAELAHQLPDVTLVPFPVVSERVRVDAWWSNPSTARLLFWEYLKYIVARVRMQVQPSAD